jgi:hypothetical protein
MESFWFRDFYSSIVHLFPPRLMTNFPKKVFSEERDQKYCDLQAEMLLFQDIPVLNSLAKKIMLALGL